MNINKENVEQIIKDVIENYYSQGYMADGIFWSIAIRVLKEKLKEQKEG